MSIVTNKPLLVGMAGLAAVLAVALVLWQTALGEAQETNIPAMPVMTIVYETDGPTIGVRGQSISVREVRRLDYTSRTEWTDTVIEAPNVNLGRYGTGSTVGSYRKLKGTTITSYDAMTGATDTDTKDGDSTFVANQALIYGNVPLAALDDSADYTRTEVTSNATVCKDSQCTDNVAAVLYSSARGHADLVIYRTDDWSIPLRLGDAFVARTVTVAPGE